jgi:hypothetical protein
MPGLYLRIIDALLMPGLYLRTLLDPRFILYSRAERYKGTAWY